ncbi:hypothetical protein [Achromobacter sp. ESBL13]|uniref:hypothetical protein n=1 Tax=Achromobacter sp. ESBL13 TaxID=3077328 RepID=UPI002FC9C780
MRVPVRVRASASTRAPVQALRSARAAQPTLARRLVPGLAPGLVLVLVPGLVPGLVLVLVPGLVRRKAPLRAQARMPKGSEARQPVQARTIPSAPTSATVHARIRRQARALAV